MSLARFLGDRIILPVVRRVAVLRKLTAFLDDNLGPNRYGPLREQFVANGRTSRWNEATRRDLAARFAEVHRTVPMNSNRADWLSIGEALLSLDADGDIVECGTYAGGSTAHLSILAKMLGKRLFVFDSFEGLPATPQPDFVDRHSRYAGAVTWEPRQTAASLDEVQRNVATFGEPAVCSFVKGWFSDTLTEGRLPATIAFAYTDVIVASSARECLRALWPRLTPRAIYFSRDVAYINVLHALFDEKLWRDELNAFPPILFGAGYGMRDASPHLGFMVKGPATPEYVTSIMLRKSLG